MSWLQKLITSELTSESSVIVFVMLFVGVLLTFDGIRQFFYRGETDSEVRNRRMRLLAQGTSAEEVFRILNANRENARNRFSPIGQLRRLLERAGLAEMTWKLIIAMLLAAVVIASVLSRFGPQGLPPSVPVAIGVAIAVVLPVLVLISMAESRTKKLVSQLPDALDLMARGLRVGHPLAVTVKSVASDMPDPIGSEFGLIEDQVNFGDDITTAFRDFADRVAVEDTRFLAVSVGIQHGTGGNLARVLQILAKVIRDRAIMRKKIKAISSEGRLSAMVLTFLPLMIFLSIHMTSPSFYRDVSDDPLFWPFMAAIVALVAVQGLILRRLVNIRY